MAVRYEGSRWNRFRAAMGWSRLRGFGRAALFAGLAVAIAGVAVGACGGDDDQAGADETDEPIMIGIAGAQTGLLAAYDVPTAEAALIRADEINEDGGVLGRPLEVEWRDTRTDLTLSETAARELVDDGAAVIIATCDFDFGSPAIIAASEVGVPGISLCGDDPKLSDVNTLGPLAFSMGSGTDVLGSMPPEWAVREKNWTRTFMLYDDAIEYTRTIGEFWTQRFEDLGGEIIGSDTFTSAEDVDVRAQVSNLRRHVDEIDFISLPSFLPASAAVVREIRNAGIDLPIVGASATEGPLLVEIAGPVSDFYSFTLACTFSYCSGEEDEAADRFAGSYEEEHGEPGTSYLLNGYDLMSLIAQAIEQAGSTDGEAIASAIESMEPWEGITGRIEFSDECHKPIARPFSVIEFQDGEASYLGEYELEEVADIGIESGCIEAEG